MNWYKTLNIQQKIKYIILLFTFLFMTYSIFYLFKNGAEKKEIECGNIIEKHTEISRGNTLFYVGINFKNSGFLFINCNRVDYYKYKINNSTCYLIPQKTSMYHKLIALVGLLFSFVLFIVFFLFCSYLISCI